MSKLKSKSRRVITATRRKIKTFAAKGMGKGKGKQKEEEEPVEEDKLARGEQNPYSSQGGSTSQAPTVPLKDKDDGQFVLRCHTRSYMYPVGVQCHWFGSLLELVCVLRDLIRSEYRSCSCTVIN
jgi:hypothetical protein